MSLAQIPSKSRLRHQCVLVLFNSHPPKRVNGIGSHSKLDLRAELSQKAKGNESSALVSWCQLVTPHPIRDQVVMEVRCVGPLRRIGKLVNM